MKTKITPELIEEMRRTHTAPSRKHWDAVYDLALKALAVTPRPIEEAPRDGSHLILLRIVGHPAHDTALWWISKGLWSERWQNWNDGIEPCGLASPTHFIPLSALRLEETE